MQSDNNNNNQQLQIEYVPISKLHFDESNPNRLTQEQEKGLRHSIERFGYLVPIIINRDYVIADGEHRAKIYKEMGYEHIPAFVSNQLDSQLELKLLRQTMNKLKGSHDLRSDARELIEIAKYDKLFDLSTLIAQNEQSLNNLIDEYNRSVNILTQDLERQQQEDSKLLEEGEEGEGEGGEEGAITTTTNNGSRRNYMEIDSPLATENTCPKCGYQW